MTSLRLVFMGTAEFAVPTLQRLAETRHRVLRVYTQPPRSAGRGLRSRHSPVHLAAETLGIDVSTPERLTGPDELTALRSFGADAVIVAAYGQILPDAVLDTPRLGCINLHGSLLPRWRGAAPIQRAIIAGDHESGVTIIQMDAGIDTGPILASKPISLPIRVTAGEASALLAAEGAELMAGTLERLAVGKASPIPQPSAGACYAKKLRKDDGRLDWRRTAHELDYLVRGLSPSPGAYIVWGEEQFKVLEAVPIDGPFSAVAEAPAKPGTLLGPDFSVACGEGALRIVRIQRAGARTDRRCAVPARRALGRRYYFLMPRYKLIIEYDGRGFVGWQRQENGLSIQQSLEAAVERFSGQRVTIRAAGRTDAGVHALGQTAHLDLDKAWRCAVVRDALNFHLRPATTSVLSVARVQPQFDARRCAVERVYRYRIVNRNVPLALDYGRAWWVSRPLDEERMGRAAQHLVGQHDFTSFRAQACQAESPVKTLDELNVARIGDEIRVTARARSFLHRQVRNMVGTLKLVGEGKWAPDHVARTLTARDRAAAGPTAPAEGLYLVEVRYGPLGKDDEKTED